MEALVINRGLSYRLYKRITLKDKKILDKHKLTPFHRMVALFLYKKIYRENLRLCIKKSRKYTPDKLQIKKRETNDKYLIKEFEFQGFIPLYKFKKFNPNYNHIISNKMLNGTYWIYPENFYLSSLDRDKGLRYIYDVFMLYGIQGFTMIRYHGNKPNKIQ